MEGDQRAGLPGSAGFQQVQAERQLIQDGLSLFGLSALVSGLVGQVADLAVWLCGLAELPFGQTGCLLGLAGLQDWAGSVGCVSESWGSAFLNWAQNENL